MADWIVLQARRLGLEGETVPYLQNYPHTNTAGTVLVKVSLS